MVQRVVVSGQGRDFHLTEAFREGFLKDVFVLDLKGVRS
jgi:hypothetical protein